MKLPKEHSDGAVRYFHVSKLATGNEANAARE